MEPWSFAKSPAHNWKFYVAPVCVEECARACYRLVYEGLSFRLRLCESNWTRIRISKLWTLERADQQHTHATTPSVIMFRRVLCACNGVARRLSSASCMHATLKRPIQGLLSRAHCSRDRNTLSNSTLYRVSIAVARRVLFTLSTLLLCTVLYQYWTAHPLYSVRSSQTETRNVSLK